MHKDYPEKVHKVNCLTNDLDALYHQAARKLGVADSVMIVAYMIYEKGDGCLLHDICNESGISKQTINSAIRKLEQEGILYLEQDKGKTKRICLTEKGNDFIQNTASRLVEAECNAFRDWTEEEFALYIKFMEKYNDAFRAEVDKMEKGEEFA